MQIQIYFRTQPFHGAWSLSQDLILNLLIVQVFTVFPVFRVFSLCVIPLCSVQFCVSVSLCLCFPVQLLLLTLCFSLVPFLPRESETKRVDCQYLCQLSQHTQLPCMYLHFACVPLCVSLLLSGSGWIFVPLIPGL